MDWLDGARYADTNGYQNDFARTMWPWRDWVIAAFNAQPAVRPLHDRADRRRPPAGRHAWPSGSPPDSTGTTGRSPRPARSTRNGASRTPSTGSRRRPWSSSASRWAAPAATTTSSTRSRRPSSTSSSASSTASTSKGVYTETRGNVPPLIIAADGPRTRDAWASSTWPSPMAKAYGDEEARR